MTRNAWIGCALSACLALVVTFLLLSPMPEGAQLPVPHLDKVIHAIMFLTVTLPAMLAVPSRWQGAVWLGVLGYSGLIELVQPVFGRGAEWRDLAANAAGAGLAFVLARRWRSDRTKVQ